MSKKSAPLQGFSAQGGWGAAFWRGDKTISHPLKNRYIANFFNVNH
jgi:hypothetical protein